MMCTIASSISNLWGSVVYEIRSCGQLPPWEILKWAGSFSLPITSGRRRQPAFTAQLTPMHTSSDISCCSEAVDPERLFSGERYCCCWYFQTSKKSLLPSPHLYEHEPLLFQHFTVWFSSSYYKKKKKSK